MKSYLFLRGLRHVDHTVFCVENGQKTYWDPQFGRLMPYSSGQQVKRSVLDLLTEEIEDEQRAPITFNYELTIDKKDKKELKQKEPWSPCDPSYADQLIGGWMRAKSNSLTLKRRSPLSISALHPLHPTLAETRSESLTFDRSEDPEHHPVIVRNAKGDELSREAIDAFLASSERALPRRHWIPKDKVGPRATGLFVFDVAIDLRRLFKVATNQHDPELEPSRIEALREAGWREKDGHLICPKERRAAIIPALAHALVNWRVTSNQSRTYSPQTTLALAVSDNANRVANVIRADLNEDAPRDKPKADPVIDQNVNGVQFFIALAARGYISGVTGDANAMDYAEAYLREQMAAFDYDA